MIHASERFCIRFGMYPGIDVIINLRAIQSGKCSETVLHDEKFEMGLEPTRMAIKINVTHIFR